MDARSRCSTEDRRCPSEVVAYWRDHFDLAHIVASDWTTRGPDLKGKIHVVVGTADTFYLDGAAHQFEAVLAAFMPIRTLLIGTTVRTSICMRKAAIAWR